MKECSSRERDTSFFYIGQVIYLHIISIIINVEVTDGYFLNSYYVVANEGGREIEYRRKC